MNWILYAAGAALALAAADVCVKLAAGRLPNSLGMLLYGSVAFATGLIWYGVDRVRGEPARVHLDGVLYALCVGVTFTLVTFGMYAAFRAGAPLSLASPLVRLGGLLAASVVGVMVWKEPVNARYVCGVVLAFAGLYLMMTR